MKFKKLKIEGWRQFENIDINLHDRLTIITGANGAGKTTILRIFSNHFGWNFPWLGVPRRSSSGLKYVNGVSRRFRRTRRSNQLPVGQVWYSDFNPAMDANLLDADKYKPGEILVPEEGQISYGISVENQRAVLGVHVNSHRPVSQYQPIASIPTSGINPEQAYASYQQELQSRWQNGRSNFSPLYRMKEALIAMAVFGPGNDLVHPQPELSIVLNGFRQILEKILPSNIGFVDINVRIPDVVLVTDTGEFVLDSASGGLLSIIDLAWQIYMFSRGKDDFVVTLDEPENHLHPSMQRTVLSRLLSAFPSAQFIVATHSPFVISSVRDASVYVLRYSEVEQDEMLFGNRRVTSLLLDLDQRAATANEVLRDVLGVPVTLPEWAEADLESISAEFSGQGFSEEVLDSLRNRLKSAGLVEYYPNALHLLLKVTS